MKRYWYVVFTMFGESVQSAGVYSSDDSEFHIGKTTIHLKQETGHRVLIVNWTEITESQYREFMECSEEIMKPIDDGR